MRKCIVLLALLATAMRPPEIDTKIENRRVVHLDAEDHAPVVSFLLNSLSKKRHIVIPEKRENNLVINLEDFELSPNKWDKIVGRETQSTKVIALLSENYYELLGVTNVKDYYKLVGLPSEFGDAKFMVLPPKMFRLPSVTLKTPTVNGYVWITSEIREDVKTIDKTSMMGTLPNKLIAYCLGGKKGELLNMSDSAIAMTPKGKPVNMVSGCLICHAGKGIISEPDKAYLETVRMIGDPDNIAKTYRAIFKE